MSTRAKFYCNSITKSLHWDGTKRNLFTTNFNPVMSTSDENKSFFAATPTGKLELGQFLEDAFEVGKEYYIDISLAA